MWTRIWWGRGWGDTEGQLGGAAALGPATPRESRPAEDMVSLPAVLSGTRAQQKDQEAR